MKIVQSRFLAPLQKTKQRQFISQNIQKALQILQAPAHQLDQLIQERIEKNPLIHFEKGSSSKSRCSNYEFQLDQYAYVPASIEDLLHDQIVEFFPLEEDQKIAKYLVGYFDSSGFIQDSLKKISSISHINLKKIQSIHAKFQYFKPAGIGAIDLQQSLLWQLENKNMKGSWAYTIVKEQWQNLIKNNQRFILNRYELSRDQLSKIFHFDIQTLNFHPLNVLIPKVYSPIVQIDLVMELGVTGLHCYLPDSNRDLAYNTELYQELIHDPSLETYLQKQIHDYQSLLSAIENRKETLLKVGCFLAKKQSKYLSTPNGALIPMTMKELAQELSLHESTVARCVKDKWIQTPIGLIQLKSLFTHSYQNSQKKNFSSQMIKLKLVEIIKFEDKKNPYSDSDIVKQLANIDMKCSRRTINKYRQELGIYNANLRKQI